MGRCWRKDSKLYYETLSAQSSGSLWRANVATRRSQLQTKQDGVKVLRVEVASRCVGAAGRLPRQGVDVPGGGVGGRSAGGGIY